MNITAITRYKHGDLYTVLKEMKWTQAELARKAGIHKHKVHDIMNLKRRPDRRTARAIQRALERGGRRLDVLEMWPEAFAGFKTSPVKEETLDVPMENLIDYREAEVLMLPAPEEQQEDREMEATVYGILEVFLSPREKEVVRGLFFDGKTKAELSRALDFTPEYIGDLERSALGKLRHPKVLGVLDSLGFSRSDFETVHCPPERKTEADQIRELVRNSQPSNKRTDER